MDSVRLERDAAGIAWVIFAKPTGALAPLAGILDALTSQPPTAVIFTGSLLGDIPLSDLETLQDAAAGMAYARAGQKLFARIERLPVPTVAAIDGACLGAGCELALACRTRIATDNPSTQLGLPATRVGVIPGWGGTQRLPALLGLSAALEIIVPGKSLAAAPALEVGLVDAVVPVSALRAAAVQALTFERRRSRRIWPPDFLVQTIYRRRTLAESHGLYPAPLKAIEVAGAGYEAEARAFGDLVASPVCQNLIRVQRLCEKFQGGAPDWVVQRILIPYLQAAVELLGTGIDLAYIDNAMVLFGWPVGPLRWIDGLGPVWQGARGFYTITGTHAEPKPRFKGRALDALAIQERLLAVMVARAKELLQAGIVGSEDELDFMVNEGIGFPPFRGGLVKWARDTGVW